MLIKQLLSIEFSKKIDRFNEIIKNALLNKALGNIVPELESIKTFEEIILNNQDKKNLCCIWE
nr:hypothetical protein [Mycoplasmopsis bovis]